MLQAVAVRPILVHNVVIHRTEGGQIRIRAPGELIFDVMHKVAIAIMITVHKKHESKILVFGMIMGFLFSFCSSW